MERPGGAGGMLILSDTGIEENTLAILDSRGIKDAKDEVDDRLAFLEAVRAASLSPDAGVAPTSKMCAAILQILKEGRNLELCIVSYQLLRDINKRFQSVTAQSVDVSNSSCPQVDSELAVAKEAWSPFVSSVDIPASAEGTPGGLIDSSEFRRLLESLVEEADRRIIRVKPLGNMLLFHYLVNVLEGDFLPRRESYRETMHWPTVKDSKLNFLLSSRRINFKSLVKDCVTLLSTLHNISTEHSQGLSGSQEAKPSDNCDAAVFMSSFEMEKCTCLAIRKFLLIIMELDALKKSADIDHQTTRGDSVRTPAFEIILDELTYDTDTLFQFLKAFDEPKWKLELAVQYLRKYIAKPSVRTRRSKEKDCTDDGTLVGLLNTLSNPASAKTVVRKIRSREVLEFLIAHAFQASLSLSFEHQLSKGTDNHSEILGGNSKEELCKCVMSAFQGLRKADEHVGSLPIGKEALFTAATILSLK